MNTGKQWRIHCVYLLFALLAYACGSNKEEQQVQAKEPEKVTAQPVEKTETKDLAGCARGFEQLRTTLLKKDREGLKAFFSFPLKDSQVWTLVANRDGDAKAYNEPVSEAEFYTNYDLIFGKEFADALAHISAKDLFEKELSITDVVTETFGSTVSDYYMEAQFAGDQLALVMNFRQRDNGTEHELAVVYFFTINAQCKLQFSKIEVAG